MSKKYFGTDGIRGTVNSENINGNMFFKFGLAAGTYFKNLKKAREFIGYVPEGSPLYNEMTTIDFLTFGQFNNASSVIDFNGIVLPPLTPSSAVTI